MRLIKPSEFTPEWLDPVSFFSDTKKLAGHEIELRSHQSSRAKLFSYLSAQVEDKQFSAMTLVSFIDRREGASYGDILLACWYALMNANKSVLVLTPTSESAKHWASEAYAVFEKLGLCYVVNRKNSTEISLDNGTTMFFRKGTSRAVRGMSISLCVIIDIEAWSIVDQAETLGFTYSKLSLISGYEVYYVENLPHILLDFKKQPA